MKKTYNGRSSVLRTKFTPVLLGVLLAALISCNLNAPQYGVLTIDFENGAARAIGANGLPELADSTMQIDITGSSIVPITKRLEKDEPKIISERLPIGETVTVTVSIITPSAKWTGSAGRTIDAGDNELAVKLNKVIASMRPIPFSVNGSSAPYTFKLNMGGTPLEIAQSGSGRDYLFFTRDGKGRLYAAYSDPPVVIRRYTSEGDYEKKLSLPVGVTAVDSFTTDLKTGKVYMSSGSTLYEIDDNGNLMHVTGSAGTIKASAAYNGYLFVYSSLPAGGQLQMYRPTGTPPGWVGTPVQNPLKDIIPITGDPAIPHESGQCQDMFAYGNKVYMVFTIGAPYDYDGSKAFYGGVLEYTYTEDGHITESGRYGFGGMKSYREFGPSQTAVYQFEGEPQDRFYGARRIIGFEDGILYIADDGAIFKSINGVQGYTVRTNINRIAKLDTRSGTLTFENTDAKWYREWR